MTIKKNRMLKRNMHSRCLFLIIPLQYTCSTAMDRDAFFQCNTMIMLALIPSTGQCTEFKQKTFLSDNYFKKRQLVGTTQYTRIYEYLPQ